jgi:hypothetical protein
MTTVERKNAKNMRMAKALGAVILHYGKGNLAASRRRTGFFVFLAASFAWAHD